MEFLVFLLSLGVYQPITADMEQDLGRFRNTNYYVVMESDYANEAADTDVLGEKGTAIARVSRKFKSAMDIEGTGKLLDGRVLNFASYSHGQFYYRVTPLEWGLGVGQCALSPFRTIAIDPKTVPLGSIVQIAETIGMELPDGTRHDGYWKAEDVGGAIKKDRIDLFIGMRKNDVFLTRAGITHLKPLQIKLIATVNEKSCVHQLMLDSE